MKPESSRSSVRGEVVNSFNCEYLEPRLLLSTTVNGLEDLGPQGFSAGTVISLNATGNQVPVVNQAVDAQLAFLGEQWSIGNLDQIISDPDGEPLTYWLADDQGYPILWANVDPAVDPNLISGTPDETQVGTNTVRIYGMDAAEEVAFVEFELTVLDMSQETLDFTVNEDAVLNDNVRPPAGAANLTFAAIRNTQNGTLSLNANGDFTYTPDSNYYGDDFFAFSATNTTTSEVGYYVVKITVDPVIEDQIAAEGQPWVLYDFNTSGSEEINSLDLYISDPNGAVLDYYIAYNDGTQIMWAQAGPNPNDPLSGEIFIGSPMMTQAQVDEFPFAVDQDATIANAGGIMNIINNGIDQDDIVFDLTKLRLYGVNPDTGFVQYEEFGFACLENSPPTASDELFTVDEDTILSDQLTGGDDVDVIKFDYDAGLLGTFTVYEAADRDHLNYFVSTGPQSGDLTLNRDGTFEYTPNENFNGEDSFTYYVKDPKQAVSEVATVTITVNPVNDPPLVISTVDDQYAVEGLMWYMEDLDQYIVDPDGEQLVYWIGDNQAYPLSWTDVDDLTNPNRVFGTPDASDIGGPVSVNLYGLDENDDQVASTPFNMTVLASQKPLTFDTNEDVVLSDDVYVLGNDPDAVYTLWSDDTVNGTLVFNDGDGTFTYTPDENFYGTDTFQFHVHKTSNSLVGIGTVTINVLPVNDAPVAEDNEFVTDEETLLNGQVVASDVDNAPHELLYSEVVGPQHGQLTMNFDGTFEYIPEKDFYGEDTFEYMVADLDGASDIGTVTITVNNVNDAPTAWDETFTLEEDQQITADLPLYDADLIYGNADNILFVLLIPTQNGTVEVDTVNNTFTYKPNEDWFGTDSFVFEVIDMAGETASATVTLEVTPVNDAPVAENSEFAIDEDNVLIDSVTVSDVDNDIADLELVLVNGPSHGELIFNPDGTFEYTPELNYFGNDSFTFSVTDPDGLSDTGVVSITVGPVNDNPVGQATEFVLFEDTVLIGQVTAEDVDNELEDLIFSVETQPANGSVVMNEFGVFEYTPNQDYFGVDTFEFRVTDSEGGFGIATVTLTVKPVNDIAIASDCDFDLDEDTNIAGQVVANDVDGDELDYLLVTLPEHGTLSFNKNGTFLYTPEPNFNGVDTFEFQTRDAAGSLSNIATATLNVNPVNDRPQLSEWLDWSDWSAGYSVNSGKSVDIAMAGSDLETPYGELICVIITNPKHGTVKVLANGKMRYTANNNYAGEDNFQYAIQDKGDPNGANANALMSDPVTVNMAVGRVVTTNAKGKASYYDSNGNLVNVKLNGPGIAEILLTGNTGDAMAINLSGTTEKSSLSINSKQETKIAEITSTNPLKSITAKKARISGDVKINNSGSYASPKYAFSMTAGSLVDAMIDTNGSAVKTLKAGQWLDTDGTADTLNASWAKVVKIAGNMQADIYVSGAAAPKGIAVNSVNVKGIMDSKIVLSSGGVKTIKAARWNNGLLEADWAKTLKVSANKKISKADGTFNADVTLSGANAPKGWALSKLNVGGEILASNINVNGNVKEVTAGSLNSSNILLGANSLNGQSSDFVINNAPAQFTLKKLNIKGINKVANITNSQIGAWNIGSASFAKTTNANNFLMQHSKAFEVKINNAPLSGFNQQAV